MKIVRIILFASAIYCLPHLALAGGSIQWESVRAQIAKDDPQLLTRIENLFVIHQFGRASFPQREEDGEELPPPYKFRAKHKDMPGGGYETITFESDKSNKSWSARWTVDSTDLGFGFRRVEMAEVVFAWFEAIGYYEYLYYRDKEISRTDSCSVSPRGKFVIYTGDSGNLFLFSRANRKSTQLTQKFIGLPESLDWQETSGTVKVHFYSGKPVKTFPLK